MQANNTLIITSHPNKKSLTMCAATYAHEALLQNKYLSTLVHLDSCGYNPVMPEEELMRNFSFDMSTDTFKNHVINCTQLALFYPDWWGMPPALLVGWLQRVLSLGVAFELQEHACGGFEILPRLAHIRMLYAISSDTENPQTVLHIAQATKQRLAHFAGVHLTHTCVLHNTRAQRRKAKRQWIERCAELLREPHWENENSVI